MSTSYFQRQLTTSRLPSGLVSRISRFSTSRKLLASGRAPQVKKLERERKREADQYEFLRNPPPRETSSIPTIVKIPKAILVDAQLAGVLSVSPPEALNIINEFDGMRLRSGSPKDLCLKYNIDPWVLTQLAKVLLVTQLEANFMTVQGLLLAATELEDPGATLMLIQWDLKTRREGPRPAFTKKAFELLEKLVQSENPAAVFLQGKLYEREGKNKLALKMYVKSTEISTGAYSGVKALPITLGDAWKAIGRLRMQGKDLVGAKDALKKAAIDHDDPSAYLDLATKMTDPSTDEYEEYLLKAAISGKAEAFGELGAHFFKKLQKSGAFSQKTSHSIHTDSNKRITIRPQKGLLKDQDEWELWSNAFEWLSLASESKIASCQIYYAIICRALQKPNVGLEWLDEASQSSKLATTIARLKETWFSNELDLNNFNLDEIVQKKTN
ncbi:hypothetical protein MMC07_004243 [Pseudocyphellaria aurata]|nr:hypothetical protein [Pseudocyphellaria aurata]